MIRPILFIFACLVFLQWHDNYTEIRIAEADRQAAQDIVEAVRVGNVACGTENIILTEYQQ